VGGIIYNFFMAQQMENLHLNQDCQGNAQVNPRQKVILQIAPARVERGWGIVHDLLPGDQGWLLVGGETALSRLPDSLKSGFFQSAPIAECTETTIAQLTQQIHHHKPQGLVAVGGGKVLDCAKLCAHRCQIPVITVPTTAATCAGWTALSNVYGDRHQFLYDVPLDRCPELLIVDYALIATAPLRTLLSGIGDALAKWYEASVSSSASTETMTIAAVQTARVLRDILFQKSALAIADPQPQNGAWQEVVDANICLAGTIGGMGGANCRTVAAHAIHNALTHLPIAHHTLHGEKVAYGILVQLRLEELQGNQLAGSSRQQLLKFYGEIGLPKSLSDLGLGSVSLAEWQSTAQIACSPRSDIHRLPFAVYPELVLEAMVSTQVKPTGAVSSLV
jgi:glycerol dehydrogenase